ncbi:MAG TPA: RNA 2',3'-cyclic phosphodiesterase [Thermoanaerobaculia bacterium]|nr:RNA 2',3'-cyclic phosphodiesterase [Thermoanaerobaculia bacterium]
MRLFIASTFPTAAIALLSERVAGAKPRLPPASWVRAESQHLTFAFLGEQRPSAVDAVAPLLRERLATIEAFTGELRGCGFFPNARHARVGWVGAEPRDRFVEVARAVRDAISDAGIELDGKEFQPHLTVMRIRDRWPPQAIEIFENALREFISPQFRVDRATLFSSKLSSNGAIHTPMHEFPLAS